LFRFPLPVFQCVFTIKFEPLLPIIVGLDAGQNPVPLRFEEIGEDTLDGDFFARVLPKPTDDRKILESSPTDAEHPFGCRKGSHPQKSNAKAGKSFKRGFGFSPRRSYRTLVRMENAECDYFYGSRVYHGFADE